MLINRNKLPPLDLHDECGVQCFELGRYYHLWYKTMNRIDPIICTPTPAEFHGHNGATTGCHMNTMTQLSRIVSRMDWVDIIKDAPIIKRLVAGAPFNSRTFDMKTFLMKNENLYYVAWWDYNKHAYVADYGYFGIESYNVNDNCAVFYPESVNWNMGSGKQVDLWIPTIVECYDFGRATPEDTKRGMKLSGRKL